MASLEFSLTERCVVNPVLYMRARQLSESESYWEPSPGFGYKVRQFIESEVLTRVTAFAIVDATVHFSTACYKGAYLLFGRSCKVRLSWNKSDVYDHFKSAAFFFGLALVGSVLGAIGPGIFKHFKMSPSTPSENSDNINDVLPGNVRALVKEVQPGREKELFSHLRGFWLESQLSTKRWFVSAFSRNTEYCRRVRAALAKLVYRPIDSYTSKDKTVPWLCEGELTNLIQSSGQDKTRNFAKAFFFHATSEKALESILKSGKVEVRHEKLFRGAFVSTQPELGFGPCVLAFSRKIERLSALQHGFSIDGAYWAGFSRAIPVDKNTLAYVILDNCNEDKRQMLEAQCQAWAGRKIDVVLKGDAERKLNIIERFGMGIPSEWPDEGRGTGNRIHRVMQQVDSISRESQAKQVQYSAAAANYNVRGNTGVPMLAYG